MNIKKIDNSLIIFVKLIIIISIVYGGFQVYSVLPKNSGFVCSFIMGGILVTFANVFENLK